MAKNFSDFSASDAERLANTTAGQQLISILQNDHPEAAAAAKASAAKGDVEQLKTQLSGIMEDPRAKALLRQLWEEYHG